MSTSSADLSHTHFRATIPHANNPVRQADKFVEGGQPTPTAARPAASPPSPPPVAAVPASPASPPPVAAGSAAGGTPQVTGAGGSRAAAARETVKPSAVPGGEGATKGEGASEGRGAIKNEEAIESEGAAKGEAKEAKEGGAEVEEKSVNKPLVYGVAAALLIGLVAAYYLVRVYKRRNRRPVAFDVEKQSAKALPDPSRGPNPLNFVSVDGPHPSR